MKNRNVIAEGAEARLFLAPRGSDKFVAKRIDGRWVYFKDGKEIPAARWKREAAAFQRRALFSKDFARFKSLSVRPGRA